MTDPKLTPAEIDVDDIVRVRAPGGGYRVWRVCGVFLGGENQEGVIELQTLDRDPISQGRILVPVDLISRLVRHDPLTNK